MPHKDPEKRRLYDRERSRVRRLKYPGQVKDYYASWKLKNPHYFRDFERAHPRDRKEYLRLYYRSKHPLRNIVYKKISKEERLRRTKIRARGVVYINLRNGKLIKLPCSVCGSVKSEAHHPDYSKPLEVEWYCKKHHLEADKALKS